MPSSLRIPVPGERSFGVPNPLTWQAALFRGLIHRAIANGHRQITKDFALAWLGYRFEATPEFRDSQAIAVWKYLCGLADKGALRKRHGQAFSILVSDLGAYETLQAYVSGQVSVKNGLTWASTANWPERNTSLALAVNHASMSRAPSSWEAPATIFQTVTEYPVNEVVACYARRLHTEHLVAFWISAGFLVKVAKPTPMSSELAL
jgi:hypothetical protein